MSSPSPRQYISFVFKSIESNAKHLSDDVESLNRLLEYISNFYVSLFKGDKGVFQSKAMDKKLSKPPKQNPVPVRQSPYREAPKKTGLGKGNPCLPRKEIVSQRQERKMAKKRKATETCTSETQIYSGFELPPKRIAPRPSTAGSSTSHDSPPSTPPCSPIERAAAAPPVPVPRPSSSTPIPPAPSREERQPLNPQTRFSVKTKRVTLIQTVAGAARDELATAKELELFWSEMDAWGKLDSRIVDALAWIWNDAVSASDQSVRNNFLCQLLKLDSLSNGLRNCIVHFTGSLIGLQFKRSRETTIQIELEKTEADLRKMRYAEYIDYLRQCGCKSCEAVVSFDESYKRYYDRLESGSPVPENAAPPRFADRPMHCDKSEPFAQNLRTKYSGLGVSSLQKAYYFACSSPLLSPPAISTSLPTDVQTTTIKYMQQFLKERKLPDPLPSSWKIPQEVIEMGDLVRVDKDSIHFYDGDSAEVTVLDGHDNTDELLSLVTDRAKNVIRIRAKHHDAPEVAFSVRIYKQSEDSTHMQTFATRHLGIESLRATRQIVFEARAVFLHVPKHSDGSPSVLRDVYGRQLMNIFVETAAGSFDNLAELLATKGYTLSFYATGIHTGVNARMREAITEKRGMFNLPEEVFVYPYRPWDLRKAWPNVQNEVPPQYAEYQPISNAPDQPELEWRSSPEDAELENSQQGDLYFFRIVPTTMTNESLCFKAPSTIAGAGYGLFLKPHGIIPHGSHLCMYAERSTTEAEMDTTQSSRDYAMETSRRDTTWFDAEQEDGNNLGRFANQPRLLEMLKEIMELSDKRSHAEITQSDWKSVEDRVSPYCNAEYKSVSGQLIVCAKGDLQPTRKPEELFASYGGLRTYWINAISRSPHKYTQQLTEIVEWLLTSSDCNWSEEQRQQWSEM